MSRPHARRPIYAWCPFCRAPIPVLDVTVEVSGWLRRQIDVLVNGDATDFVAHMWTHAKEDIN